ncbi:hypothetical protein [Psychromonas sp. MME2]|uniref:hypothetical protein n=1 Tax=unclassified Psychromonas TaxID=2614957 RepID=UPI00339C7BDD
MYDCIDVVAATAGEQEMAISYWETAEAILQWKRDPDHYLAQKIGRNKWYQSYYSANG